MFGMVTDDVPRAARVLLDGPDGASSGELAEHERAVDALYHEVEQQVGREIMLQAPVASDLRFLLSVLRMAPELERSHDLVMQIASAASRAGDQLSESVRRLAGRMGDLVAGMWRQAAGCWGACDHPVVAALDEAHAELAELHASLTAELATGRMTVPATMEMTLVARCYERLGAHALNIARREAYVGGCPVA
jgi:phosphate transport system protein